MQLAPSAGTSVGQRLVQTAQHQVRRHLPQCVAHRHRRGVLRVQDAVRAGRSTVNGSSEPALFGISGPTMQRRAKTV